MNGTTLKALRLALGFTQEEAAKMIGHVSMRTWRYWEDEDRTIPVDVISSLRDLATFKKEIIEQSEYQLELEEMIKLHTKPEIVALTHYASLDLWMTVDDSLQIQWKPHCMAMSALAEKYPFINLIEFDAIDYQKWLDGRKDDNSMRAKWAALQ